MHFFVDTGNADEIRKVGNRGLTVSKDVKEGSEL